MTARYLLDTSVILDHLYGHLSATVLLARLFDEGAELLTCDVVVCELMSRGDDAHLHAVSRLLTVLDYVPTDPKAARAAGAARQAGRIGLADALIWAVARRADATVVVRKRPGLKRLGASVLTY